MSLAQIVTNTPDEVAYLSRYLRSLGYTVELVDPESLRRVAAELNPGEDMLVVSDLSESANAGRRVIAYDITGRPVEFADDEPEAPAKSRAFNEAWQGVRSARIKLVEQLRLSSGHLRKSLDNRKRSLHDYRERYQQLRAEAVAKAAESRRDHIAQQQAFQAERSRRRLEQQRRKAQFELERQRLQAETRQQQQEMRLAGVALPDHEPLQVSHRYRRDSDLRMAAVAAAVLALLAIAGLGAYRNRLTPRIADRDVINSQPAPKPVAFEATTASVQPSVTPAAVKLPSRHRLLLPQSNAAVKPTAAMRVVSKHPVRSAHPDDDFVGEDRVIIHRLPGATTQARANTHTGPRRISDLE